MTHMPITVSPIVSLSSALPDSLHIPLRLAVAEALSLEIASAELLDCAGRFAYVRYQPIAAPDPDAVICVDLRDCGFNQAILRLQAYRWRGRAFPRWLDWERRVTRAIWGLYAPLDRMDATRAERGLALGWAWAVLRKRSVING